MDLRRALVAIVSFASLLAAGVQAQQPTSGVTPEGFVASYTAGQRDGAGRFMGGTEMRNLLGHRGVLYAGNGYWMDRPGPEGRQPAQLLRLDEPAGRWRVERHFVETPANGPTYRHLAVADLLGVSFASDGVGRPRPQPFSMHLF